MLIHPQFDPVAFSVGPVSVRWYGLMYLVGFACFYLLGTVRAKQAWRGVSRDQLEDLLFYGILGVVLGGRLGYCFFYQPGYFLSHPLDILKIWEGGMSAHGGMVGVACAVWYFHLKCRAGFLRTADFIMPMVPAGLFFGRLGNFINGELWGRPAAESFPLAMIFPQAGDLVPRHPSQLYECALEGAFLFVVLWCFSRKPRALGSVSGLFFLGYGLCRFFVEFFREPDAFLGLGMLGLSRGQWLSVPLLLLGVGLLAWSQVGNKAREKG